jgi:hypothetical protein
MRKIGAVMLVIGGAIGTAHAQTTIGAGTTIVFPVTAQTSSFTSEVTIFNSGPNSLNASVAFYEANNSSAPGPKTCADIGVPAMRSVQFSVASQCTLAAGSHFGLLIVADKAIPQANFFYGYTRVQNPSGIGFSIEGFPASNFTPQTSFATGLKRQAAAPTYQTNCFVGSLEQPVSYEVRLFDDSTGAQIGGTLTGALAAFEQFRYLDVFGPTGVNAPAGDQFNVRAQFKQTSGGSATLIGFCTVQDNTSFGADFRIAKTFGVPGSVSNIVWVAKAGATYSSIQAAINAAAASASPTNTFLVKIAPGVYGEQVTLADYVDVEGSGPNMTQISYNGPGGTVVAGARSEMRNLAVLNTFNGSNPGANAIFQTGNTLAGSTKLQNLTLVADGPADNLAVYVSGGSLLIIGSDAEAALSGTQTTLEAGIFATGATASVIFKNGTLAANSGSPQNSARKVAGAQIAVENSQLKGTTFGAPLCFQNFDGTTYSAVACP